MIIGKALCYCGHVGDTQVPHPGKPGKGKPLQHAGLIGHGACLMYRCSCTKFTWKEWLPGCKPPRMKGSGS